MGRQESIAVCIVKAITREDEDASKRSYIKRTYSAFSNLFALYKVPLTKHTPKLFSKLRNDTWMIDESQYVASFFKEGGKVDGTALETMGDMGYSGSTFFSTANQAYLVKSIPRHFEHSYFREDLLDDYVEHMISHQDSALIRITDLLSASGMAIGIPLGLAPSHHIIMENILYGQSAHRDKGGAEWESWDLKPTSYFFPERDIADGKLTSEATKSRLADEFNDKLILSSEQSADLIRILETDTKLLADRNAVDYSLFLVRIAVPDSRDPFQDTSIVPDEAPFVPPGPPSWRTGVVSPDGKHVYRAAILDFFWAKHKAQPKLMTGLIKAWNLVDRQGPMSITADPAEYRSRFLEMCRGFVEVRD